MISIVRVTIAKILLICIYPLMPVALLLFAVFVLVPATLRVWWKHVRFLTAVWWDIIRG